MKTHEFVRKFIDESENTKGIRPLNYLEVAEENGKFYLSDCEGIWEHIPENWDEFLKLFITLYHKDISSAYSEGQFRLRQATKELLGINV